MSLEVRRSRPSHVLIQALRNTVAAAWLIAFAVGLISLAWTVAASEVPEPTSGQPAPPPVPYRHVGGIDLPGVLSEVRDVAAITDTVAVADGDAEKVVLLSVAGVELRSWDAPASLAGPDSLWSPFRVAADVPGGQLLIVWERWAIQDGSTRGTQTGEFRLEVVELSSDARSVFSRADLQPLDVDIHLESDEIFVLEAARVIRLDALGQPISSWGIPRVVERPSRIAVADSSIALLTGSDLRMYTLDAAPLGVAPMNGRTPLDVTGFGDDFEVLLQGPDTPVAPEVPLLMVVSTDGGLVQSETVGEVGLAPPQMRSRIWSLDRQGDSRALLGTAYYHSNPVTSYDDVLTVASLAVLKWGDPARPSSLLASNPSGEFRASLGARSTPGKPLNLSVSPAGALLVQEDTWLATFDADTRRVQQLRTPPGAEAVHLGGDGRITVAALEIWGRRSGNAIRLRRSSLVEPGPYYSPDPARILPCRCDFDTRLAGSAGVLYVARPFSLTVGAYDIQSGTEVATAASMSAGVWPSDVAIGAGGILYTADLGSAGVQRWSGPGQAESAWPAGARFGPERIAVGPGPSGDDQVVALMADDYLQAHSEDGSMLARWRPYGPSGEFRASDLAVDGAGRLYLANHAARRIEIYQLGEDVPPVTPTPESTPTPSAQSCSVTGDKTASPSTVALGQTATVSLGLAADCPFREDVVGADIMLAIERYSWNRGDASFQVADLVVEMVRRLDYRVHQVGATMFVAEEDPSAPQLIEFPLSTSPTGILNALMRTDGEQWPRGATRPVSRARELLLLDGRPDALPVIVVVTSNRGHSSADDELLQAVRDAQSSGITVFVVASSRSDWLTELTGDPDLVLTDTDDMHRLNEQITRVAGLSMAGNLVIDDELAADVAFIDDSASLPPQTFGTPVERLRWTRSILPASGITMTYEVRPERVGRLPTNRQAVAYYTDFDGSERQFVFPVPEIEVVAPTATPLPRPLFLPILYRSHCVPIEKDLDVVLAIDTSSSMSGAKLSAARQAASTLVAQLETADRAAVVGFDSQATVEVGLTSDRADLEQGLQRLAITAGTRIDLGLAVAHDLLAASASGARLPVIVLLTDGAHDGDPVEVRRVAARIAGADIRVIAIGLGEGADMALLRSMVRRTEDLHLAPDGPTLVSLYEQLGATIPCR